MIRGEKDFVIYYRLLPWDHLSGDAYSPLSPNQVTIFAASPELAETIKIWLTR